MTLTLFIPDEFLQLLELFTESTLFVVRALLNLENDFSFGRVFCWVNIAPIQPEVQGRTGNLEFWQMLEGPQPLMAPVNQ